MKYYRNEITDKELLLLRKLYDKHVNLVDVSGDVDIDIEKLLRIGLVFEGLKGFYLTTEGAAIVRNNWSLVEDLRLKALNG